jgi:hypothetical protein
MSTNEANLAGSGAIAQGPGATAIGAGGVFVGGNNTGNINVSIQPGKQPLKVPFQAPAPAADQVQRRHELARLKQLLLDGAGQLLPNTVGLHGFGGTGKTTLARLFCADPAVRQACRDGILWVPLGKNPPDARAQIVDLVTALVGDCNGCMTLPGARAQLQAALSGRQVLLVLDDVWDEAQIKDIVEASAGYARLITTRNTDTLPFEAYLVDVATMREDDAMELLGAGLPPGQEDRLHVLARRLGCWPVLLRLANRTLRHRVQRQKTSLSKALDAVDDLTRNGVVASDPAHDVLDQDQAVAATVEASLELLVAADRQRYTELAIFPQDVSIPLARAAELWSLTAGLNPTQAEHLVASRLEPLSLLEYDGDSGLLSLHDVLRSYLSAKLPDRAAVHRLLADHWGDRPARGDVYAWRWLALHRAQAAIFSEQPQRHASTERLVALVTDETWQQSHEAALEDLPALRGALSNSLEAAVADDVPLGLPLVVRAADALVRFNRDHLRAEPIFELARHGDLDGARRRSALFPIDEHWRQALLLTVAWLAPPRQRDNARQLCTEIQSHLGTDAALHHLLAWIRADLWADPAPAFAYLIPPHEADETLLEELLKRVGGGEYNRSLIVSRGLDPDVQNPDAPPPTRGVVRQKAAGGSGPDSADDGTTTRYLAEIDGPYLVTYAANDPSKGTEVLSRYLSVYTNYNYAEYRFSTLWLLLGFAVQFPRSNDGPWVQDTVLRILDSALSGATVEFEGGLAIAATALRAQAGDQTARAALETQALQLIDKAASIKPGRDRDGGDIWAHHKRLMLASAQALGWLLGEQGLARQLLQAASNLADSGFAGYQAPACLALAEAIDVCGSDPTQTEVEQALGWAQRAAHNVQDPTFCARMTARVNAMRRYWWQAFNVDESQQRLTEAGHLPGFAALHRVGHEYIGRRADALKFPPWACDDRTFDGLARLYQRPKADFLRLNGGERPLNKGEELAVPDPGFVPHLAARFAAETLAKAGGAPLSPDRMEVLRLLVPRAVPSPTALDAVLTRLVLAQARREPPPDLVEATALDAVLARRPLATQEDSGSELIAGRTPSRLPA